MRSWQDFDLMGSAQFTLFLFSGTFVPGARPTRPLLRWLVEVTPLYRAVHLIRGIAVGAAGWSWLLDVLLPARRCRASACWSLRAGWAGCSTSRWLPTALPGACREDDADDEGGAMASDESSARSGRDRDDTGTVTAAAARARSGGASTNRSAPTGPVGPARAQRPGRAGRGAGQPGRAAGHRRGRRRCGARSRSSRTTA